MTTTVSPSPVVRNGDSTGRGWRVLAAAEVALVLAAVLLVSIPSLVVVALAVLSLLLRRTGFASLGFHRVARPARMAWQMLGVAAAWSVVNVAVLMPVADHVSGREQDVSDFAELQGDVLLLLAMLALGWSLAALGEELAFRGLLLTRLTDLLGAAGAGRVVAAVLASAVFGAIHTEQGVVGVVVAAVDGLVYCVVRYRWATLWAPVLAHGFMDTIGFVAFFLVGPVRALW